LWTEDSANRVIQNILKTADNACGQMNKLDMLLLKLIHPVSENMIKIYYYMQKKYNQLKGI